MNHVVRCGVIVLTACVVCGASFSGAGSFTLRVAPDVQGDAARNGSIDSGAFFAEGEAGKNAGQVSAKKAVLYSMLLPGWGQYYLGKKKDAYGFFIAEGVIWAAFITFETQGYLREEGYKDFAQVFAGVSDRGHSDDFFKIISQYRSSQEYEEAIKKEGRAYLYPDASYDELEAYFIENRVSDFEPWLWRSTEDRWSYRSQRSSSKESYRRAVYSVAAAVANRLVSSFFAWKAARDVNRSLERGVRQSFQLQFGPPRCGAGAEFQTGVSIIRTF